MIIRTIKQNTAGSLARPTCAHVEQWTPQQEQQQADC